MTYEFYEAFELRYRDIDPDTKKVIQDNLIAITEDEAIAGWLTYKAGLDYHDPNREFYYTQVTTKEDEQSKN